MSDEMLFVGLDEIGASIGLALARAGAKAARVGYDPDAARGRAALRAGAVDRLIGHLGQAPRPSGLVFLSTPPADVPAHLEALLPFLAEGAVVIDTSALKTATLAWAAENLPPGRHLVGARPVAAAAGLHIGDPEAGVPRADLFQGGLLALVVPPNTPEEVVDLVLNLAHLLGAQPYFMDAAEVDAVAATVESLPALIAAAFVRTAERPGWHETRRLAGRPFASTAFVGSLFPAHEVGSGLALNRANALAKLDAFIEELSDLRALVAGGEDEALVSRLAEASKSHDAWLAARRRADWGTQDGAPAPLPERPGLLERWFGVGDTRRKPRGS